MEDFEKHSYISGNQLNIGVENMPELKQLIDDVIEKEKALQKAVHKLNCYQLQLTFINK
ncbi:hypothetical protein [Thomasclavelia ramosa]|uniref:hypothetical protein n=1 Tax=Thomasclavelia ramosa TaxID=1547 RepID=UPI0032C0E645